MALVVGIALAPLVLPMIASWGGPAQAQSLPWTPTPEPTDMPTVPSTFGTAVIVTPILPSIPDTSIPDDGPGDRGSDGGDSSSTTSGTPTATAEPGTHPDLCEPNDSLTQPCSLPSEVENGNLNFVDDSIDVVSVLLKGGRTYTLRASSSTGIDPAIRVYRAGDTTTALVENDDVSPGTTDAEVKVTTEGDGWYLVVIENKAPGDMRRRVYSFRARSSAAEQPTANPVAATQAAQRPVAATVGDLFENNYSPETAATLAWGVPFDLSLVCPDQGRCPGGDHDFFWVPVKAGVPLVAVTYDLGPGADPAITLYRPDANFTDPSTGLTGWRSWAGNDDVVPGFTLRSQLLVTPDWSGYALLVVASSERTDPPPMPPAVGMAGRYRLMIGPPGLEAVQHVLNAQHDIPAVPTAVPSIVAPTSQPVAPPVAPTPASDAREVIKEESVEGEAVVIVQDTSLYAAAPPTDKDELAVYPEGAVVILLGQTYAGWVKVQPVDSVTPGWMFGPNLRPRTPARAGDAAAPGEAGAAVTGSPVRGASGQGATTTAGSPGRVPTTTAGIGRAPQITLMPPLPTPTPASSQPEARAATVEVCAVPKANEPTCTRPLEGVRVELVRVSDGAVLFVGLTNREGRVAPSITVAPGTAVDVQIGALGLRTRMPANDTFLPVRVVEGVSP